MLSTTCSDVAASGQRGGGSEPVTKARSSGNCHAQDGEKRWVDVQEWPDGSRYEGEFVNGLKHGNGKYIWENGEYYEGSFYKDYKHGGALYSWPTGHKFIGKFYLNRREGYGQQMFPDGTTFQGLYHFDQRFGPGVLTHPDGRQDVGLWLKEHLLRLCTSVEEDFSLNNFPEYAAYVEPSVGSNSLSQVVRERAPLPDDSFIYPPGIESYSTDGDHLPLPPARRKELDQHFFGKLWEPEAQPHHSYERDPLATLPLQARMEAHIQKHRLEAKTVGWDVAAILSLKREGFGPKGPLEVTSERLIQHSSHGDLQAVSQIIRAGLVHPDVADSQGHTALIAATVNCHNDVIHVLLNRGVDINKLNNEGMSALAVCYVLYYPFESLYTVLAEPLTKTPDLMCPSSCGNASQTREIDFTLTTTDLHNGPQTTDVFVREQANFRHLPEQKVSKELIDDISHHRSKVSNHSELITKHWLSISEPETPADTVNPQDEEKKDKGNEDCEDTEEVEEGQSINEDENENQCDERQTDSGCDQSLKNGQSNETAIKIDLKNVENNEEDVKIESRETESRIENMVKKEEFEEDVKDLKEIKETEHSLQGLNGHIALSSVQWKETEVKDNDKELTPTQIFESACSASNNMSDIHGAEEGMTQTGEALCCTGIPCNTQETVHKVAAMKIEPTVRLKTLKLLLERGADPNRARIPMPVLFLAIMAADTDAVKTLLLCGARADIPLSKEKKSLYPLHVAAALPGPAGLRMTELLLHTAIDPDAQACDQNEVYEPDKISMLNNETLNPDATPHRKEGGRTALHIACQRDSDHQNASKVVALLLSHRASTDLLWSGHSPLSLAIASGNDLAVEELLNGGADPNIPLGCRVGSALCALANINYHLGDNRIKMLEMLTKAGADILMPVTVGDVVGTAVDYVHYSFSQDKAVLHTSFPPLNKQERRVQWQLLRMMGDLLRQTADQRQRQHQLVLKGAEAISSNGTLPSCDKIHKKAEKERKPLFQFCYHCGRSAFVKLTACSCCNMVFFCSWKCKNKAQERHNKECMQVSGNRGISLKKPQPRKSKQCKPPNFIPEASADGIQKNVVFKSQRGPKPINSNSKNLPPLLSVSLKSHGAPKSLNMAEKPLEGQVSLRENYSHN
ncbi:ankyrin repeat and MYND domain-containing protein 1 isoform X2 [Melanotaenia boesemani]|uniref:ankyrin repeat and MYND domain-containing protein 1 isoform X2 n=1 Tax=Melanotaenia boesemani TaxID=1250792 RepID=UPI001C03C7A9|nr:ankyrin repeat and MYND domain-containing protein 1 isoform X2 [Melanotaenia boesemani]